MQAYKLLGQCLVWISVVEIIGYFYSYSYCDRSGIYRSSFCLKYKIRVGFGQGQSHLYLWKPEHLEKNQPMVTALNGTCQDGALAKFSEFFSSPIFEFRLGDYQTDDNPNAWIFLSITELYLIRSWNKIIAKCVAKGLQMGREGVANGFVPFVFRVGQWNV